MAKREQSACQWNYHQERHHNPKPEKSDDSLYKTTWKIVKYEHPSQRCYRPNPNKHRYQQPLRPFFQEQFPSSPFESKGSAHSTNHEKSRKPPFMHPSQDIGYETRTEERVDIYSVLTSICIQIITFSFTFYTVFGLDKIVSPPIDTNANMERYQQSEQDHSEPIDIITPHFLWSFLHKFR